MKAELVKIAEEVARKYSELPKDFAGHIPVGRSASGSETSKIDRFAEDAVLEVLDTEDIGLNVLSEERGYIDRGAEGDASWAEGGSIARLDAEYFEVQSERGIRPIPYHRILQIQYGGAVAWERGRRGDERLGGERTGQ